jgi:hypothetical protein
MAVASNPAVTAKAPPTTNSTPKIAPNVSTAPTNVQTRLRATRALPARVPPMPASPYPRSRTVPGRSSCRLSGALLHCATPGDLDRKISRQSAHETVRPTHQSARSTAHGPPARPPYRKISRQDRRLRVDATVPPGVPPLGEMHLMASPTMGCRRGRASDVGARKTVATVDLPLPRRPRSVLSRGLIFESIRDDRAVRHRQIRQRVSTTPGDQRRPAWQSAGRRKAGMTT